jgi:nucleobase transporter 1/2
MAGTAHGGPIGAPPKIMKGEDMHHHALEQLPQLAYCINDNPRWGKQESCRFQYSTLLLMLLLLSSLILFLAGAFCCAAYLVFFRFR